MRRLACTVAYDGTNYAGWQRQLNAVSIQQVIEEAIEKQFHETVHVMGSGRTDAGVHARGQVACFDLMHPIPCDKLVLALNANLPDDIRILNMKEVSPEFHPQYDAKRKTYSYSFVNASVMPPEYRLYAHLVPEALDLKKMEEALSLLAGEHDFVAFRASGGQNLSTVRNIYEAKLSLRPASGVPLYEISVTGNGFLYNMVRIIAGTLFDIGRGRIPVENVAKALENGDRELLGVTAPAKGLTLVKVEYEGLKL